MCKTCGCSDDATPTLTDMQANTTFPINGTSVHQHDHEHSHSHHHALDHDHDHHDHEHHADGHRHDSQGKVIRLDREILARNNLLAERNRGWFAGRDIVALNIVSAPGAGKTTLLERTLRDLGQEIAFQVIEGDQATLNDARRIQAAGGRVVQINTGAGCHLDAVMVARGLETLDPPSKSVLFIENVGNLVCPALFDLGEDSKVLVCSVTDGDDKPIKYPHMFRASSLLLLNKIDLLPHVPFDVERFRENVGRVNPNVPFIPLSATRGDGIDKWYAWLHAAQARTQGVRMR